MNVEQYDQIADKLLKTAHEIEVSKRPAYTIGSADVFKNFKSIAERVGLTPQQVSCVYWLKHVDAITAYLSDPTCPQAESIESRFADCINYLKLSYAMGLEDRPVEPKPGEVGGVSTTVPIDIEFLKKFVP